MFDTVFGYTDPRPLKEVGYAPLRPLSDWVFQNEPLFPVYVDAHRGSLTGTVSIDVQTRDTNPWQAERMLALLSEAVTLLSDHARNLPSISRPHRRAVPAPAFGGAATMSDWNGRSHMTTTHQFGATLPEPDAALVHAAENLASAAARIATASAIVSRARDDALTDENTVQLLTLVDTTLAGAVGPIAGAAARFPDTPSMDFLLEFARLVRSDQELVRAAASAAKAALEDYPGQRLEPAAYGFASFYSWLCGQADPAAIALVCYADVVQWHTACTILVPAMEKRTDLPSEVLSFFAVYRERPDEFLGRVLAVAADAVAAGGDLDRAVRSARLMEHPLSSFWDAAGRTGHVVT